MYFPGGNQAVFQKLGTFQDRFVGLEVAFYCGKVHCGQASLDTLEALPHLPDDFFNPPPGAVAFQPPDQLAGSVIAGRKIKGDNPLYPEMAKIHRVQGEVLLRIVIGTDGSVQQVHPVFGPTELIPSAVEAVRTWRYQPFQANGKPVPITSIVRVIFQLG